MISGSSLETALGDSRVVHFKVRTEYLLLEQSFGPNTSRTATLDSQGTGCALCQLYHLFLSSIFRTGIAEQIPSSYSTADNTMDNPGPPPSYTAPTQFSIGSQLTPEPLVNISQIKAHLALLHAFAELKKEVAGLSKKGTIAQMPGDLERRWAWFVALAVQRSVLICCYLGYFHIYIFFIIVDLTFGAVH